MKKSHKQALLDKDWWEALLPPGWRLHGWTNRHSACAFNPNGKRLVELDAELLASFKTDKTVS